MQNLFDFCQITILSLFHYFSFLFYYVYAQNDISFVFYFSLHFHVLDLQDLEDTEPEFVFVVLSR